MSIKIFYFHIRDLDKNGNILPKGGYTIALCKSGPLFNDMDNIPKKIFIDIGIAKVHPDDLYNKKTGREEAARKTHLVEMTLNAYLKKDFDNFIYSGKFNDIPVSIIVRGSFIRHAYIGE